MDECFAGNVTLDQIVLRIESPFCSLCQQQAGSERIDTVGQGVEARFTRMLLGQTCELFAEIGIAGVGECVGCRFRIVEIDGCAATQKCGHCDQTRMSQQSRHQGRSPGRGLERFTVADR